MRSVDVSICIVNWNTKDLLANCIDSIHEKTTGISYEIIVVDNMSYDGSAEMVRQCYPQCRIFASKENLGFAGGNNVAVKEAQGKYVLYLNPDTVLATNAIYGMFQYADTHPEVGAVGCKLLNQDGSVQFTCARTYPTLWNQFCELMMLNRVFPRSKMFSTIEMNYWDHKDSRQIDCLSGACILARKSIIDKLGGFDENLFMYAEDVDLCFRINLEGKKIYYLADEKIYHLEGQSSKQQSNKYYSAIIQRESNHYYTRKHFGAVSALFYRAIIFIGSSVRLLVTVLSVLDPSRNRLTRERRHDILLKYFNLLLWSSGFSKRRSFRNECG